MGEYLRNGKQISFYASGVPDFDIGYMGKLLFDYTTNSLYIGSSGNWEEISSSIYSYSITSGSLYNTLSPTYISGVIKDPVLYVNGFMYFEDAGTSGGFTIEYSGGNNTNYLKWNFNHSTGFQLEDTDNIYLKYQI